MPGTLRKFTATWIPAALSVTIGFVALTVGYANGEDVLGTFGLGNLPDEAQWTVSEGFAIAFGDFLPARQALVDGLDLRRQQCRQDIRQVGLGAQPVHVPVIVFVRGVAIDGNGRHAVQASFEDALEQVAVTGNDRATLLRR